jgi:hypothetical protein
MGLRTAIVDAISAVTLATKERLFKFRGRTSLFSYTHQRYWLDSSRITIDVLDELYERNGLAHNVVDLLADKSFNKWCEYHSDDSSVAETLEHLCEKKPYEVRKKLKEAFKLKWRHGYSLLIIGYKDAGEDLSQPVKKPLGITAIEVVGKRAVKEFLYEDQFRKGGEIIGVKLNQSYLGSEGDLEVHASRFIIIGDTREQGVLFPAYNWLNVFDNIIWAMGQSFWRYASGFPFLQIDKATPDELKEAQELWENVTARSGFVGTERHKLDFLGANGRALPVKDYFDAGLRSCAISMGVPFALIEGAHAGAVTGSETNSGELYDKIAAIQETEIEPILHDLFARFAAVDLFDEDSEYEISWVPLWQLDEKERAEVEKLHAETDLLRLQAGVVSKNEVRRARGLRLSDPDEEYDIPCGDEYVAIPTGAVATMPPLNTQTAATTRNDVVAIRTQTITLSRLEDNNELEAHISSAVAKLSGLINYDALIKAIDALTAKQRTDDDQAEFLAKVDVIIDSNLADAREATDFIIDQSWVMGADSAKSILGVELTLSAQALLRKGELKSAVFEIVKGLNGDVKRQLRNTLLDELQKVEGTDLTSVKNALKETLTDLQETLPETRLRTIARTESNRAFTDASQRVYQEAGVKQWQWITARDDRVRPDHARNEGHIRRIGELFPSGHSKPPAGPNCRCDVIPVVE